MIYSTESGSFDEKPFKTVITYNFAFSITPPFLFWVFNLRSYDHALCKVYRQ